MSITREILLKLRDHYLSVPEITVSELFENQTYGWFFSIAYNYHQEVIDESDIEQMLNQDGITKLTTYIHTYNACIRFETEDDKKQKQLECFYDNED